MKAKARSSSSKSSRDSTRRVKKKTSILVQEKVTYVDWKDVNLLRRFMSDRAKIRARRVTGNDTQQQRQVAQAIKLAREMALLPYTSRVTTQRGRPRRDDDERRPRREEREAPAQSGEEFAPIAEGGEAQSAGQPETAEVSE
jgi:small subunit ribosomal protein S18